MAEPLRCPRCGGSLEAERFYGPCATCRIDLATSVKAPKPDNRNYKRATLGPTYSTIS